MNLDRLDHRRVLRLRVAAGLALIALAPLTACGSNGGDDAGDSETPDRSEMEDAALEFAQCMREHGVPMEDPEPGGGMVLKQDANDDPEITRKAQEACEPIMAEAMPDDVEEGIPAEDKEAMLAQAKCMREHGFDVPDPQFDGGRVTQMMEGDIDPEDPAFQKAQEDCAEESGLDAPRMEGRP